MRLLVNAFLDDYNQITCTIGRDFNEGKAERFTLLRGEDIWPLPIESVRESEHHVIYTLSCPDIEMGQSYQVMGPNGYTVELVYRFIVKSERFNNEYYYDGDDLGCRLEDGNTVFRLWAPTSSEVTLVMEGQHHKMVRRDRGVYSQSFRGDLSGKNYHYLVCVSGEVLMANDPYARASLPDSRESVVIFPQAHNRIEAKRREPVIYEVSVRDYTEEGTFACFSEHLDYLKDLGVSHIQLLPVNDFGSVNELHKELSYNWGYDPVNYQVLEGSYSSDVSDPAAAVEDFTRLVRKAHEKGLKINLDVVFNHVYAVSRSPFHRTVPYYWFRYQDARLAAGTFCGNEVDTEMAMVRKYIIDTCLYYVRQFDVDGFRFDLMGFIDVETMKQLREKLTEIKPGIMMYGEGWNMNTAIRSKEACMDNYRLFEGVGFFNDFYRDVLKGSTFDDEARGYGSGEIQLADQMIKAIRGDRFEERRRSVNYVECHDNLTLYDKLVKCCPDDSEYERTERQKLITTVVLLSQGISLIHGGQEFCMSKNGLHNNYNTGDEINKLTEERKQKHQEVIDYVRDVIALKNEKGIGENRRVSFINDEGVILYSVDDLLVIINPSAQSQLYTFARRKRLLLDRKGKCDPVVSASWTVEPLSVMVLESVQDDQ
ncbi:MAG: type I pullulanase [Erysipelotrichaceae bacterium]|nr:type I pullulanase [Erysipelotrichaceae bacterium]